MSINKASAIADLNAVNAKGSSVGNKLGKVFKTLGKVAVAAFAIIAAAGAAIFVGAIKKAAEFEKSMAMVQSVTGATAKQFEELEQKAKELGKTSKFSMTEIADGMEFLGRAGFETTEIISAMDGVVALASSQVMDLGAAADITSNILTGMGMSADEAARVADVLAQTAASANVNVEMLGESFKYAAPLAAAAGWSIEETAAAIGKMGDAGIQSSMAGTALRMALSELIGESDLFKEKLGALGMTMDELKNPDGSIMGMADVFGVFEEKGFGAKEMLDLFGKRAGPAMAILLQEGSDGLDEYTRSLEGAGGAAQRMADIQLDTLSGQLTILKGSFDLLLVTIGEDMMPILKNFLKNTIIPIVNGITEWIEKMGGLRGVMGHFLIAIGGVFHAIADWIRSHALLSISIDAVWSILKELWSFVKNVFTGDWAAAWQDIKDVAVLILGLIHDAVVIAWDALPIPDATKKKIEKALVSIRDGAVAAFFWIKDKAVEAWGGIKASFDKNAAGIVTAWETLKVSAANLWGAISEAFTGIQAEFGSTSDEAITFSDVVEGVFDALLISLTTVIGGWSDMLNVFASLLRGDWQQAWTDYKVFLSGVWDGIVDILDIVGLGEKFEDGFWAMLPTSADWLEWGRLFLVGLIEAFSEIPNELYDLGRLAVQGFIDGFTSKGIAIKDAIVSVKDTVTGWIHKIFIMRSPSKLMHAEGQNVKAGFVAGMIDGMGDDAEAWGRAILAAIEEETKKAEAAAGEAGTSVGEAYIGGAAEAIWAHDRLNEPLDAVTKLFADGAALMAEELAVLEAALADTVVGSYAYGEALQDLVSFHENLVKVAEFLEAQNIEVDESLTALIAATIKYADAQGGATEAVVDALAPTGELTKKYKELTKAIAESEVGSITYISAMQGLQSQYDGLMSDVDFAIAHNIELSQTVWDQIDALIEQGVVTRDTARETERLAKEAKKLADEQEALKQETEEAAAALEDQISVFKDLAKEIIGVVRGAFEDVIDGFKRMTEAAEDHEEALNDIADRYADSTADDALSRTRKEEDALTDHNRRLADIAGDYNVDLSDLRVEDFEEAEDYFDKRSRIETDYQQDMADERDRYARKLEDIDTDHTRQVEDNVADREQALIDEAEAYEENKVTVLGIIWETMTGIATNIFNSGIDTAVDWAVDQLARIVFGSGEAASALSSAVSSAGSTATGAGAATGTGAGTGAAIGGVVIQGIVEAAVPLILGSQSHEQIKETDKAARKFLKPVLNFFDWLSGTGEYGKDDNTTYLGDGGVYNTPTMLPKRMVAEAGVSEAYIPLKPSVLAGIGKGIVDSMSPSMAMAGGGSMQVDMRGLYDGATINVRNDGDITAIAKETHDLWKSRMRGLGRNV